MEWYAQNIGKLAVYSAIGREIGSLDKTPKLGDSDSGIKISKKDIRTNKAVFLWASGSPKLGPYFGYNQFIL